MYSYLTDKYKFLLKVGLNTLLRISDLLELKVDSFVSPSGKFHSHLRLNEKKTGSYKQIPINQEMKDAFKEYIRRNGLRLGDYLFFPKQNPSTNIGRITAWKVLSKASKRAGIDHFGTHSMRKTGAWYIYETTKDLAGVQRLLNHNSSTVTLRYIGVDQKKIDELYDLLRF